MTDRLPDAPLSEWLRSQEFYELCQRYRHAGDVVARGPGLPTASEAFEEMQREILARSETVQPSVCWVPCAKHQGLWFNTAIATAAAMRQVCPHCESETCQHDWTYYPNTAGKPFNQCSKCRVVREV